jgi:riboflavin biosynthesis pyrimidine reductase
MTNKSAHIICHMASTINGKTLGSSWGRDAKLYSELYQECHESFNSEAWMCGRVTMEKDFTGGNPPKLVEPAEVLERTAFVGNPSAVSFAVAIDAKGKLGWQENEISGDHIIAVLTEKVSDAYLQFLRKLSISYVFAGETEVDLAKAIQQLTSHFPIKTIMLEGGGHINGALLDAGLIDEISLLLLPIADNTPGNPTTFENPATQQTKGNRLKLDSVQQLKNDVLWLKYKRT